MTPPLPSRRSVLLTGAAAVTLPLTSAAAESSLRIERVHRARHLTAGLGARTNLLHGTYSLYGDLGLVSRAMRDLHLSTLREKLILPRVNATQARHQRRGWRRLADDIPGFDVCLVGGRLDGSEGTVAQIADYVADRLGGDRGAVVAVENANEPNDPREPWNHGDPDAWIALTRDRQRRLAREFRGRRGLDGIRLLGPSITGNRGMEKYRDLGDLTRWVDGGNFHHYPALTDRGTPGSELRGTVRGVRVQCGRKPVWCTETGSHQARNSPGGFAFYPEDVAAEYALRTPFEHLRAGVARTYFFELLDDEADPDFTDPAAHFGLIRNDGTRKPAYAVVRRMMDLLHERHRPYDLRRRGITLHGLPRRTRAVLLHKRDGRHFLALWRDEPLWDRSRERRIRVERVRVGVRLDRRADVREFRLADRAAPVRRRLGVDRLGVDLGGSLVLLELS